MKSGFFAKLRRIWTDKSNDGVASAATPAKKSQSPDAGAKKASGPPKRDKPTDSRAEGRKNDGEGKRDQQPRAESPKKRTEDRGRGENRQRDQRSDQRSGQRSDQRSGQRSDQRSGQRSDQRSDQRSGQRSDQRSERGGGRDRRGGGQDRRGGGDRSRRRSREEVAAQQEALATAAARRLEFPPFEEWEVPAAPEREDGDVYFQDLPINPRILKALLVDMGFTKCTPIQGMALPDTLAGKDVAGRAQTGTGKTAAFLINIFNRLLDENPERAPHQPFALCIAPTRELAIQIEHDAAEIGKYCGLSTLAVYGGMNYDQQRDRIAAGVDLVTATPGRLLDYVQQRAIDLSKVQVMVIDEADRMLDMGFIPDVRRIIARLCAPANRQTLLFSATLDRGIMDLAQAWMRPNPVVMETDPEHMVAESIEEIVYAVSSREKLAVLLYLIKHETWSRILIFRNQRRDVERLYHNLHRYGVHCEMLSGDVPQKKRLRILEAFRKGDIPVVVATDVAGRGIHVDDISHVVNYDFPFEAEDYVHRIGRTGRAGNAGKAVSLAGSDCAFVIPEIEEYIGRPLPTRVPEAEMVEMPPAPKGEHGELPHPRRNPRPSGRPNRSGGGRPRSGGGGRSRSGGGGRRQR